MSGKKSIQKTPAYSAPTDATPPKKEEKPYVDVLANISPSVNQTSYVPHVEEVSVAVTSSAPTEASIPDWLKESTMLNTNDHSEELSTPTTEVSIPVEIDHPVSSAILDVTPDNGVPMQEDINTQPTASDLPDWLKGESGNKEASIQEDVSDIKESLAELAPLADDQMIISNENLSDLPAWMRGVDQDSLRKEVDEEMSTKAVPIEDNVLTSYEDIPDWLKNSPVEPVVMAPETKEISLDVSKIPPVKKEKLEQKHVSQKKQINTAPISIEESSEVIGTEGADASSSRSKKKKPAPIISE